MLIVLYVTFYSFKCLQEIVAKIQQEYKAEKEAIAKKNKEVQKKVHKKEQLIVQVNEFELEIKKLDHDIKKLKDDFKISKNKVRFIDLLYQVRFSSKFYVIGSRLR